MNIQPVPITFAAMADQRYSLYRRIRARIVDIKFHAENLEVPTIKHLETLSQLESMVLQLDKNSIIPHIELSEIRKTFNNFGTTKDHMISIFGTYLKPSNRQLTQDEKAFLKRLKDAGNNARINELRWRLENEIIATSKLGWYCVFQTLTVSDYNIRKVFNKGSRCWSDYIRDVERSIGRTIYGSVREAERNRANGIIFHKYFAVVERGDKGNRLHIHVIHLCKDLPKECKIDPNTNLPIPFRRNLRGFSHHWPYGYDRPIAVRFAGNDSYTKLGWIWPVEKKKGATQYTPVKSRPPIALARYVCKYVTKAYGRNVDRGVFRCRMSRNLGTRPIMKFLEKLDENQLQMMTQLSDNNFLKTSGRSSTPMTLLRRLATKELMMRIPNQNIWKYLTELKDQKPIVQQYRTMTQTLTDPNMLSTIDIPIQILKEMDGFDDLRDTWLQCITDHYSGQVTAGPTSLAK